MADTRFERDDEWDADRVPSLIEDDDSLPWLDFDDDDRDSAGFATSRLVILGILALLLIGGVVAAVMLLRNMASDEPPADGSLIAAPEEPYKTRPEDDGGKTFAGTGDTSFAVGEGQTREGQLADRPDLGSGSASGSAAATAPSIATTLDGPEEKAPATPPTASGVPVQVGAFPKREDAEAAWTQLVSQTEALAGVRHRVVEARVDIGRVYRLQALSVDQASARRLCSALKADGLPCFVK